MIDEDVVYRIKKIRGLLDKTQKDMANLVGASSFQTWQAYELGRSYPTFQVLEKLSSLGVNIEWLVKGDGEPIYEGFKKIDTSLELDFFKNVSDETHKEIVGRIKQIMAGQTARAFAKKVGIRDTSLRSIFYGNRPSFAKMVAIAKAGGVSIEWLATGDKPLSTQQKSIDTDFRKLPRVNVHSNDNRATLPVLGMAACGPDGWAIRENSTLRAVSSPNVGPNSFCVMTTGESMQPYGLFEGSLCYCDPDIAPKISDIVCIERIQGETVKLTIKKIGLESTDSYEIFGFKNISQNALHETQQVFWEIVKKDEIQRISVVKLVSLQSTIS